MSEDRKKEETTKKEAAPKAVSWKGTPEQAAWVSAYAEKYELTPAEVISACVELAAAQEEGKTPAKKMATRAELKRKQLFGKRDAAGSKAMQFGDEAKKTKKGK